MTHYTHLSQEDRYELFHGIRIGRSIRDIAKSIGRHFSTLYRELQRHQSFTGYRPYNAQKAALQTRHRSRGSKIKQHPVLRRYIITQLKENWSPEQIVGRLKRKNSKYTVSHETIYQYIYKHRNTLSKYLPYKRKGRRKHRSHKKMYCKFGNKRLISNRPAFIDQKAHIGHWEGDRIEFINHKSAAITTLVERRSRFILLIKNNSKQSDHVMAAIADKFLKGPVKACRTITFDQGTEFAYNQILEGALKCQVYYCHRHAPWEKGANENMNGRLRWFLPKKSDILKITQEQLDLLAWRMNNTPRKCLDFKTPKEMFLKYYKFDCRTWF